MSATDPSPLCQLVTTWWQAEYRPSPYQAPRMWEALFSAALAEIVAHIAIQKPYDVINDHRFKWAVQHLELVEGNRRYIDENVTHAAQTALFGFTDRILSPQHRAANDIS